ncbi:MAG: Crp/Fnr family transcriptional regulator [Acidobacteriota bacterium]|nr:Crp/Fnr family transcriptional regulator [Acidobacteriota bacterium]
MKNFLNTASRKLVEKLKNLGRRQTVVENRRIFSEGETAEFLPVVVSGKVKMVRFPEVGKEVIIGIFESGDIFAIPPVFDGAPYPATAVAMEKTDLLLISREDFLSILSESGEMSLAVIGWMCGMLREKTETIQNLATASPEHRIGNVLLRLAKKGKLDAEKPYKIQLRRQDIAEMAGLTTETTIRAVRKLAEKNLVKIVRGKIILEDRESLCRFLDS